MAFRSRLAPRAHARVLSEHLETRVLMAATPELLRDINQATDMLGATSVVNVGAVGYFTGRDTAADGPELFRTDGTKAGTRLVADVAPGIKSSAPQHLTSYN